MDMSLLAHCGNSVAISCSKLRRHSVPRACTLSAANSSRTNRVVGSRKLSPGGVCLTSAIWNDINDNIQNKRFDLGVMEALKSSLAIFRLHTEDDLGLCRTRLRHERVTGSGKFHLNVKSERGIVIRCSINFPVPSHGHPRKDPISKINGEHTVNHSPGNETRTVARGTVKAAFFDVDDNFDRATFNRIFYSNHYKGRSADSKRSMAALVYERYYKPRIYLGALDHIRELKQLGYRIVFVTGALDFQIAPLARELEADFVYAAELVEENGRFTGKLNGMATSNSEKAERVLDYAKRFDVSLEDSLAFGDSIADISMLEMVGRPHAVNPDSRLLAIALQRKWTVLSWTLETLKSTPAAEPFPA